MAFTYLLLGHLLGDFVLQTDKIALNKGKHWQWNLLHVLVVTLCILMLSYHFGVLLFALVLINGIIHYVLDIYKANITKMLKLPEIGGFLFDQFAHVSLLYIMSFTAVYSQKSHIVDNQSAQYMVVLIFVTSFSAIFNQFAFVTIFPRNDGRFFEEGEKQVGILSRIFLIAVLYLTIFSSALFAILTLAVIPTALLIKNRLWFKCEMTYKQMLVKFLLDCVVAMAGIIIIYFIH